MAKKGQTIENNVTGEIVTFLETAADSNGKRLRFELRVKPKGYVVVNHVHPRQDEKFELKKGRLKVQHGKETGYLESGDKFLIPKGKPHQWWNDTDEEVTLEVEFTPAGNMEVFLEQIYGLTNDGKCDAKGVPPFMQIMAFSNRYDMYLGSGPPVPLQKFLSAVLGPVASLMGYRKYYEKYAK